MSICQSIFANYSKAYKKDFLLLRGIDKYFKYFLKNFSGINYGLFEERRNKNRLNKVDKIIDLFDEIHPPNTPLPEIRVLEVESSYCLLDELSELTDCYVDEEGNLDEVIDNLYIDQDFPE